MNILALNLQALHARAAADIRSEQDSAGGASAARALLVELAHLHRPADAGRCFTRRS